MKRNVRIIDGNTAAADIAYNFSDVAFVYPITPATPMSERVEKLSTQKAQNLFDNTVTVREMQSEAGVAGAMHGSLVSGALTSTFTASQGLLLMVPNIYKMAAEHLPGVIYVAARSIATHALSIFGDHSDIYAIRQTGACIFCVSNVQEIADLAPIAHTSAIIGKMPVVFSFDGFRTSHETQKIEFWDKDTLKGLLPTKKIEMFRESSLNPNHPKAMGSAQNPDVYFQAREASNLNYIAMPEVIDLEIQKINNMLSTKYAPHEYYGASDAEHVIVAMGSVVDTAKEAIDYLASQGKKVGVLNVRLFRPFSTTKFLDALPASVRQISVLDRSKEPGSAGEPLYQDIVCALSAKAEMRNIEVFRGRYGLASKDTTPEQIVSVFNNTQKREFTIGINDDVTKLSLDAGRRLDLDCKKNYCCKVYGNASDGTISSVKAAAIIIGEHTDNYCQVYAQHDAKVSGSLTTSHLRFGPDPISEPYFIDKAQFVSCNHFADLEKYKLYGNLTENGNLLLNCPYSDSELSCHLSSATKKFLSDNNIHIYTIDADTIAKKIGLKKHINTVLITAAFCVLELMDHDDCANLLKKFAEREFKRFGQKIVEMNKEAIDCARDNLHKIDIPSDWKTCGGADLEHEDIDGLQDFFADQIQKPIMQNRGDEIPVSAFIEYSDGATPVGMATKEKTQKSQNVVKWNASECIQCNHCSFVCPHGAIRPYVIDTTELQNAPVDIKTLDLVGDERYKFAIGVSTLNCTGCKTCISKCPKAGKALRLGQVDADNTEQRAFEYLETLPKKQVTDELFRPSSVKGSQFKKPLLEFPNACSGCGQTAYAKLLTQLFGERMIIANATGCSSIWGNSFASSAYSASNSGRGPAWSNSLFEDAAEFGYGMLLAQNHIRENLKTSLENISDKLSPNNSLKESIEEWIDTFNNGADNVVATDKLVKQLEKLNDDDARKILAKKDYMAKKSQWVFGGDGWAYDIGFGGLDHVLATNQDINILVFDTECYSNTGGQASKATREGAIAKLASDGKNTRKKDLAGQAMLYDNVYVASVSMGANLNQCIKAFTEAERHSGPSLIIAYSPCKHHGLHSSSISQIEEERAVGCGYRTLFRYNPDNVSKGKEKMQIDSSADLSKLDKFLSNEDRFREENYTSEDRAKSMKSQLKDNLAREIKSLETK